MDRRVEQQDDMTQRKALKKKNHLYHIYFKCFLVQKILRTN